LLHSGASLVLAWGSNRSPRFASAPPKRKATWLHGRRRTSIRLMDAPETCEKACQELTNLLHTDTSLLPPLVLWSTANFLKNSPSLYTPTTPSSIARSRRLRCRSLDTLLLPKLASSTSISFFAPHLRRGASKS